jgi:hypothetical protein
VSPSDAVVYFVAYAAGKDPQAMTPQELDQHAVRVLHDPDPAWKAVADEAALLAFKNHPGFGYVHPTAEGDEFLLNFLAGRPASWPLLQQGLAELKRAETRGEMQRRRNAPVSTEQMDQLGDDQVTDLYQQSLRERTRRMNKAASGEEPVEISTAPSLLQKP